MAYYARRYYPPRYFASRYFTRSTIVVVGHGYFPRRYFAASYFPTRYFTKPAQAAPARYLLADAGHIIVQGKAADLSYRSLVLVAETGNISVSGNAAILTGPFRGEYPRYADPARIPRWLLKFERLGNVVYLSTIGGEVGGIVYVPAVLDVSLSDMMIDLERLTVPQPSGTVTISPSALRDYFIDLNELGQAKVTVSSWDGLTVRPVLQADMESPEFGYEGNVTTFRLSEKFRYNPTFPEKMVDYDRFPKSQLEPSARFRCEPFVYGDAQNVPSFQVKKLPVNVDMICGHDIADPLPDNVNRYHDALGDTWIGTESSGNYSFTDAKGVETAEDLIRRLIQNHSTYPASEVDDYAFSRLYKYLQRFNCAGYIDQEGPLMDLFARRYCREYMFLIWQEGGKLRAWSVDPTAHPTRDLVYRKHLLCHDGTGTDDKRYTGFKVRYKYSTKPDTGWYGVCDMGSFNNDYLKAAEKLWGYTGFGDPVEWKRHANSVDLADVTEQGTATVILNHYAKTFHRGKRHPYLMQAKDGGDLYYGQMVNIIDPDRGYDLQKAIFIGRRWVSPEFVLNTFRTIEPFDYPQVPQGIWG